MKHAPIRMSFARRLLTDSACFGRLLFAAALGFSIASAQTVYLPNGAGGIQTSVNNANVGIGINEPPSLLSILSSGANARTRLELTVSGNQGNQDALVTFVDLGESVSWSVGADDSSDKFVISEGYELDVNARFVIDSSGDVGIGTITPSHKLTVNGTIRAKEIIVDTGWSDYVFADEYRLAPLSEVEAHIREKRHLPGIPSASEVEAGGVSLGDMQATLLAKIEELTLHLIAQEKRLKALEEENRTLRNH